jgi:hypothetical protein
MVHDGHEVEAGLFGCLRLLDHAIEQAVVGDTLESEIGHVETKQWVHLKQQLADAAG